MSTAGKVLVVMVTLALLVWLGLLSMVAQRNANWGQKIKAQEEEIAKLQKEQVETREQLAKIKNDIARAQEAHDQTVAVLRSEKADREKNLSDTTEELERMKNRVKGQLITLETTDSHLKHRGESKTQTIADLEAAKAEVEKLKGENSTLMAQLAQLRSEFLAMMDENRKLVDRLTR
jgi:septal ring factor EnvC (AmiA/AmiB activator)